MSHNNMCMHMCTCYMRICARRPAHAAPRAAPTGPIGAGGEARAAGGPAADAHPQPGGRIPGAPLANDLTPALSLALTPARQ
eukprot:352491-Prymnesium_polylepis.1